MRLCWNFPFLQEKGKERNTCAFWLVFFFMLIKRFIPIFPPYSSVQYYHACFKLFWEGAVFFMLLHVNVMVMLLRCEGKFTARVQSVFN